MEINIEDIVYSDIIGISISKDEVNNLNFEKIDYVMKLMKETGKEASNKLYLSFNGYENPKKEIYNISSIRKWMRKFAKKHPYFLYFIEKEQTHSHIPLLATISQFKKNDLFNIQTSNFAINPTPEEIELFMIEELKNYLIQGTLEICNQHDQKSISYILSFFEPIKSI